ncbi:MAG: hypothetical protein OEX98_09420, partial [Nitrosopumilus sp.]|nr:hypothetical protein [Nitrosopumilus sp.]
TQNRELTYRIIAYNCHRIIQNNLLVLVWFLHGHFSIVSPYIETIQKTDQEFREIAKKMNKAKRKKP